MGAPNRGLSFTGGNPIRSTLDRLVSWVGLGIVAVMLAAGGLLTWASTFVADQVDEQLSAQAITMPVKEAMGGLSDEDVAALKPYAGQQMKTGAQAKAYADHYILAHMNEASGGKSYAEVSNAQRAACSENADSAECAELTELKASQFQGSTLRGLLLYGYAFWMIGKIAGYAAIAAFVSAALFIVLALLGFRSAAKQETAKPETGDAA